MQPLANSLDWGAGTSWALVDAIESVVILRGSRAAADEGCACGRRRVCGLFDAVPSPAEDATASALAQGAAEEQ